VLAKDGDLYFTHQQHMPTWPVVLHTENFQGCGVLTVLYNKTVLKCTARKDIHSWKYEGSITIDERWNY